MPIHQRTRTLDPEKKTGMNKLNKIWILRTYLHEKANQTLIRITNLHEQAETSSGECHEFKLLSDCRLDTSCISMFC